MEGEEEKSTKLQTSTYSQTEACAIVEKEKGGGGTPHSFSPLRKEKRSNIFALSSSDNDLTQKA